MEQCVPNSKAHPLTTIKIAYVYRKPIQCSHYENSEFLFSPRTCISDGNKMEVDNWSNLRLFYSILFPTFRDKLAGVLQERARNKYSKATTTKLNMQ